MFLLEGRKGLFQLVSWDLAGRCRFLQSVTKQGGNLAFFIENSIVKQAVRLYLAYVHVVGIKGTSSYTNKEVRLRGTIWLLLAALNMCSSDMFLINITHVLC